ncbi:MAG: DUF368 domain-containing protein [Phycisphaerales bacterium JB063]
MTESAIEPDPALSSGQTPSETPAVRLPLLAVRGGLGGVLMGLANLVPGISGGTMLLAAGVYPRFIEAIGEVTTFKFRKASLVVLGTVVAAAMLAILLLAGTVKGLVVDHRWVMYSLFIGLTLGGVPVVWRLVRGGQAQSSVAERIDRAVWIGAAVGFVGMAALALFQSSGVAGDTQRDGFVFLFLAGIAGASAMILPGVSGGYLLLVLGVYVPILAGVDAFKDGLKAKDTAVVFDVGLAVVLPVGLGVLVGVVGVSNLLRWLLKHHEKATLGVLLGLLIGAVIGLWPFQQTAPLVEGQVVKGQAVTLLESDDAPAAEKTLNRWVYAQSGEPVEAEDLPTAYFTPSPGQVGGALGLILLGLGGTLLIDRLQGQSEQAKQGHRDS